MKIVVAGATGLIGQHLSRALHARGDEVVALVRKKPPNASWNLGLRYAEWDGKRQDPWAKELEGAGAVVNLSGANVGGRRWTSTYKDEILESRVDSTRALVEAMKSAAVKPRTFLCASAVGYYGGRGSEPLDESKGPGTDFLAQVCVQWEAEARKAEALEVRTVCVRTGVVLARPGEGGALAQMVPPYLAFVGGPLGSGKQYLPWIHIDDEVASLLFLLDHAELSGPVNAASPSPQTMNAFSALLGKVLGRPHWARVPAVALRLAVGEFAAVLLDGQRALPARLEGAGFRFKFPELEPALKDLLDR